MIKKLLLISFIFIVCIKTNAQVANAKEFSKELSTIKAKKFLVNNILDDPHEDLIKFEIDALAASNSGELTTLTYNCESQNKSGLLIGFYNDYWNENGVTYNGYSFKNFNQDDAEKLFTLIDTKINEAQKYLRDNLEENHIYFKFQDLKIVIHAYVTTNKIRVFWNDFDADWDFTAYTRSKKRMERWIRKNS